MLVGKFFTQANVRDPNRVPDARLMAVFEEILDRRLPADLIEPEIKQQMMLKSGGILRELIRIADLCCDVCLQEVRRQMRKAQFDQPPVKITQAVLDQVLTDLQISFAETIGRLDQELLRFIYAEFEPQDVENQRFLDLLHSLYILEYRNGVHWYDLHPIVTDLLQQKGVLSG